MNIKFYESHYEEYIQSLNNYNIHPELEPILKNLPDKIYDLGNLIVYGPSGVGKYTQTLHMIKKYSPSNLKYDKKIKVDTDKNSYIYRISDIHYEIDMALLGCNSKIIWHEVFLQIVDIISVKNDKKGIILCKNFHMIHTELLEIFYSYIQQYNHPHSMIQIRFIISTEHVSFLPNNILQCCKIISIMRPSDEDYINISQGSSEGFAEPLENRRFSDQASGAKQNLDSLSYATEGCSVEDPNGVRAFQALYPKGPLTRIPYGSEGLSGPQPRTPFQGVQRNPTTNDSVRFTSIYEK